MLNGAVGRRRKQRVEETGDCTTQVGSGGRSVGAGGSASGALAAVNCTWQALLLLTNVSSAKCADLRVHVQGD